MASEQYRPEQAVRFIGGKYNGFQGTLRWVGDTSACIIVVNEQGKPFELVEDLVHLQDLTQWKAGRSKTELALKST